MNPNNSFGETKKSENNNTSKRNQSYLERADASNKTGC